jgi:hypothetical protein
MGVYLEIHLIKEGKRVKMNLPELPFSYKTYIKLFIDETLKIEKLSKMKLDMDFFNKANESGYGVDDYKDLIFDPKTVSETLKTISKTIKDNPDLFPKYYSVSMKIEGTLLDKDTCFIDDEFTEIRCDWDTCYYFKNSKKIDLRKKESFTANEAKATERSSNGKWHYVKGDKHEFIVYKTTFFEFFEDSINNMINICNIAEKKGCSIQLVLF